MEKANRRVKNLEGELKAVKEELGNLRKREDVRESEEKESLVAYIEEVKSEYKTATSKLEEANNKARKLSKEVE